MRTSGIGSLLAAIWLLGSMSSALAVNWPTKPRHTTTPGAINTALSLHTICTKKWGVDQRKVSEAMKQKIRDVYGFQDSECPITIFKGKWVRRAEIDHLVPRSLGGADEKANLWPQCYEPIFTDKHAQADGANKKDRLEKELHSRLCDGSPTTAELHDYQRRFMTDWKKLYSDTYPDE